MGRKGVALFGLGRAGMIHFTNIISNHRLELLYVVDKEVERVKKVLEEHNQNNVHVIIPDHGPRAYTDTCVDMVFVCSPTYTHENIVRHAIQNGKAVFCEKPVAETREATEACYGEAEKYGVPLLCSFNRRFDPSVSALRDKVKRGEVGAVYRVTTCSRDYPLPPMEYLRISGGIFHDCAVHDIDMICWVLGEYPTEVYTQAHAHLEAINEMDDVDTVVIIMKFPSNVIATIDLSRNGSYGYDQRLEVFGTDGMLISDNHQATRLEMYTKTQVSGDPLLYSFPQRYADSYKAALNHFLDVLDGKGEITISKKHTVLITEIASACEQSHRENRRVILTQTNNGVDH